MQLRFRSSGRPCQDAAGIFSGTSTCSRARPFRNKERYVMVGNPCMMPFTGIAPMTHARMSTRAQRTINPPTGSCVRGSRPRAARDLTPRPDRRLPFRHRPHRRLPCAELRHRGTPRRRHEETPHVVPLLAGLVRGSPPAASHRRSARRPARPTRAPSPRHPRGGGAGRRGPCSPGRSRPRAPHRQRRIERAASSR